MVSGHMSALQRECANIEMLLKDTAQEGNDVLFLVKSIPHNTATFVISGSGSLSFLVNLSCCIKNCAVVLAFYWP